MTLLAPSVPFAQENYQPSKVLANVIKMVQPALSIQKCQGRSDIAKMGVFVYLTCICALFERNINNLALSVWCLSIRNLGKTVTTSPSVVYLRYHYVWVVRAQTLYFSEQKETNLSNL